MMTVLKVTLAFGMGYSNRAQAQSTWIIHPWQILLLWWHCTWAESWPKVVPIFHLVRLAVCKTSETIHVLRLGDRRGYNILLGKKTRLIFEQKHVLPMWSCPAWHTSWLADQGILVCCGIIRFDTGSFRRFVASTLLFRCTTVTQKGGMYLMIVVIIFSYPRN